jgi:hypothetical protein
VVSGEAFRGNENNKGGGVAGLVKTSWFVVAKDIALNEAEAGIQLSVCRLENLGIVDSICWYKVYKSLDNENVLYGSGIRTSSSVVHPISKCRTDGPNIAPADINNLPIVRASTAADELEWIDSLSIEAVDFAMEPINCEGLRPS